MTFILSEDEALRDLLKGILVSDDSNPARPVGVWFGQPDPEIRKQSYPYITIDLIDVKEDPSRAMRNYVTLPYLPDGSEAPEDGEVLVWDYPIPHNLDYQVTTYARHPRHDRQILHALLRSKLPSRYGSLHIEADNTERSMFLLGMVKRNLTEDDRRLFSNALTVRVFSELTLRDAARLAQVTDVNLSVYQTDHP
jgi:hypothetical protein